MLTRVMMGCLLGLAISAARAWACTCIDDPVGGVEAASAYDLVFVGVVRDDGTSGAAAAPAGCGCGGPQVDTAPGELDWGPFEASVQVTEAFKGTEVGATESVAWGSGEGSTCDRAIPPGETWLFHLREPERQFYACTPGGPTEDHQDEIDELRDAYAR